MNLLISRLYTFGGLRQDRTSRSVCTILGHAEGHAKHDHSAVRRSVMIYVLLRCDGVPIKAPSALCWPTVTNQHWLDTQDGIVQRRVIYCGWRTSGRWPMNVNVSVLVQNRKNEQRGLNSDMQVAYRCTSGLVIMHVSSLMGARSAAARTCRICVCVCVCVCVLF
jgi:hypothetical protein